MADRLLGSFVWCELMTADTAGADAFYKKVVGWTSVPFAPDGSYTVFNNPSGAGVAGLMKLPDAAKQMGAPPHWLMYVGTPNVDDTAMRIVSLGGRVLKQPDDIPNTGRFAVVQDPFGAAFGIYTPKTPGAGKDKPGVGDFSWFELYTPNPEGAWNFYQTLFGWEKTSAMDMGEMGVYQMYGRGGGIPNGGIMKPLSQLDGTDAAQAIPRPGFLLVAGPVGHAVQDCRFAGASRRSVRPECRADRRDRRPRLEPFGSSRRSAARPVAGDRRDSPDLRRRSGPELHQCRGNAVRFSSSVDDYVAGPG